MPSDRWCELSGSAAEEVVERRRRRPVLRRAEGCGRSRRRSGASARKEAGDPSCREHDVLLRRSMMACVFPSLSPVSPGMSSSRSSYVHSRLYLDLAYPCGMRTAMVCAEESVEYMHAAPLEKKSSLLITNQHIHVTKFAIYKYVSRIP